ncbi:hypothetical protein U2F26_06575 [Micromonospora sp. 4G57]|uniref:Integral membrane protein n=1 Tax=Micromonospora sicca TaxID=2202420 RepID=A0ABU5JGS8_9ACTN|nr:MULTISPECIES: hypothetical protein [unclassified Micromonospora]MDZ5442396.1 hypothetical protein [Micromonospora sp. 4G57]MDZ5491814.1 hypothetical protein [Micromonospora sp. 4G53]
MTRHLTAGRRRDLTVLAVEAALLAAAVAVGAVLNHHDAGLHADAAPLYATWRPHFGWGTLPAVLLAGGVVARGPHLARRLPWPWLLAAGWLATVAWTLSLALVDGWRAGLTERLTVQAEYLHEVPRVRDLPTMLAGFTERILDFRPDSWSTHTAGHPPGALLVFVGLDRIGLGGGTAAALACILVGATVTVSVPLTLRALGDEPAARAVLPFLVLLPGAVWVGASADGIFAAVVAAGLALLARPGRWAPGVGGLLLGVALHLSYGLVLAGLLALTVLALRSAERIRALCTAGLGVAAVTAVFVGYGFWWLDGYHLVVRRYYQGWAADRPYAYWVWANLAALLLSTGPAAGPALARSLRPALAAARARIAPLTHGSTRTTAPADADAPIDAAAPTDVRTGPAVWLSLAAALTVAAADGSGLSKAEVERIWLPFAVWLLVAVARLPAGDRRWWLAGQGVTALAVNHLLWTVS